MVSFGLLTLILVLMLFAFTSKMDEMIAALHTMSGQFSSMSKNMTIMRTTLHSMESNVSYMPVITRATSDIRNNMAEMRTEVDNMSETMSSLNIEVLGITGQVNNMTMQIRLIDPAVQHIGRDVYRMSGPARMVNKFNPFD
jgi:methyl-accepting chemotaxis protein